MAAEPTEADLAADRGMAEALQLPARGVCLASGGRPPRSAAVLEGLIVWCWWPATEPARVASAAESGGPGGFAWPPGELRQAMAAEGPFCTRGLVAVCSVRHRFFARPPAPGGWLPPLSSSARTPDPGQKRSSRHLLRQASAVRGPSCGPRRHADLQSLTSGA
ncbi:unnamed protein product [Prorocentrum cordatum]|uniref:Uncharacterized protein n=1 Tax=Prorocentrum cordatum TaxID=2364126 RepID=A0ABN9XEJ0_9DINO|nr:unnamed protein product [Polarella glacialis]